MANSIRYANNQSLASLLELQRLNTLNSINCHQVGEIVSFDPDKQTAEVQIKMIYVVNGEIKQYPVLLDCPCVVLGGGEGRITFPISAGDSCLVLFNDKDLDNWYASGQTMLPNTERMHSFSDAIAIVGLRNLQNKITDYFADGVELKHGNSSIKLKDGYIDIKGNVNIIQNTVDDNSLHAYVISSYHSGPDWYRIWSDGWCEQGGLADRSSSDTVNLLVPMVDTNYSVFMFSKAGHVYAYQNGASTTTSFKFNSADDSSDNNTGTFYWEVKGYIK